VARVRERLYRPSDRNLSAKSVATLLLRIEGATWSAWRIPTAEFSVFYTGAATFFFQVAPQLHSWGWVGPIPDPLLLDNLVTPGIEPGYLDLASKDRRTRHNYQRAKKKVSEEGRAFDSPASSSLRNCTILPLVFISYTNSLRILRYCVCISRFFAEFTNKLIVLYLKSIVPLYIFIQRPTRVYIFT
jgi:hypothetical protein